MGFDLERVKGIEPSYEAWEAAVLPLNYTRVASHYRHSVEGARPVFARGMQEIGSENRERVQALRDLDHVRSQKHVSGVQPRLGCISGPQCGR